MCVIFKQLLTVKVTIMLLITHKDSQKQDAARDAGVSEFCSSSVFRK